MVDDYVIVIIEIVRRNACDKGQVIVKTYEINLSIWCKLYNITLICVYQYVRDLLLWQIK